MDRLAPALLILLIPLLPLLAGCGVTPGKPRVEADVLRGVVQLTRPAVFEDATGGRMSPDGDFLVFRATPVGEPAPQLYVARVLREGEDGDRITGLGTPVRVTPVGSRNDSPAFGPGGRTLLFASSAGTDPDLALRRGHDAAAEVYRVDDWQRTVAAADPRRGVDLARHPITRNGAFDGEPAVSPDGAAVVFSSARDAPGRVLDARSLIDLYAGDLDGERVVRLTDDPGRDGGAAFSPDGRSLFFHSDRHFGRFDVYRMDLQAGDGDGVPRPGPVARLTRNRADASGDSRDPTVRPDGGVVVYVHQSPEDARAGNTDLRQMQPDGRRDFPLTFGGAADDSPSFSPDGRHLIFSSKRTADGSRQLYVARYVRPRRGG